jgi:hypothetical protein
MSSEKTSSYELPLFEPAGLRASKDYKNWKADTMDILSTRSTTRVYPLCRLSISYSPCWLLGLTHLIEKLVNVGDGPIYTNQKSCRPRRDGVPSSTSMQDINNVHLQEFDWTRCRSRERERIGPSSQNCQQPGTNPVICLRTMIAQSSDNDLHSQYLYRNNFCTLFKGHLMLENFLKKYSQILSSMT